MFSTKRKQDLLFPYHQVRKSQENLIIDVEKSIQNKSRLIAYAPTGLGKTVSVLGPALSYALKNKKTIFFLTNRHTQHQLAVETLKEIKHIYNLNFSCVDLIGKRWMCNQEVKDLFANEFNEFCKALTEKNECNFLTNVKQKNKLTPLAKLTLDQLSKQGVLHNQEIINHCQAEKLCSYEISLELAKKAQIIIGDYYYLFNPFIQQNLFNKINKEMEDVILVVDEAHNLPGRMVEMLSHSLTTNMIKNALLEVRRFGYEDIVYFLEKLNQYLSELNDFDKFTNPERLVKKKELLEKINQNNNYVDLVEELDHFAEEIRKQKKRSYLGGIATFLEAWLGEDQGFTRIISEKIIKNQKNVVLSYHCLDPSLVTNTIFERVHSAILMSGTLNPPSMYNDILSVKGEEKIYSNPFPPENKLTLVVPETTTKYSLRGEKMYQLIAEKCSQMISLIPGNNAIFFPSYQLRDNISYHIQTQKKKFLEKPNLSKEEKEEILTNFKKEKDSGAVLLGVMGGSFGEGIDLPGNLLNAVIIVGVPLSKPDLKTREIIRYFEEKFGKGWDYGYLYPAINKCFQSAGRCIRSENDKGVVIYLDARFTWDKYFSCFPREGVIVTKDFTKFLTKFF